MVKASTPEAFAFIGQMLTAAGYTLVAQRRSGGKGRYLKRTFVRNCNDDYHLEVWQYVDTSTRQVLFMDLSLWRNDDMAPGRAVRYQPVRGDLTDVVGVFSDERNGIGTLSRDWTSKTMSGKARRLSYRIPADVLHIGFGDTGGITPPEAAIAVDAFWTRPKGRPRKKTA